MFECYLNYKTRSYLQPWECPGLTSTQWSPMINILQTFSLIYSEHIWTEQQDQTTHFIALGPSLLEYLSGVSDRYDLM